MSGPTYRIPETREAMEELFHLILQLSGFPEEARTIFRAVTSEMVRPENTVDQNAALIGRWREGIIKADRVAKRAQELILEPSSAPHGEMIQ